MKLPLDLLRPFKKRWQNTDQNPAHKRLLRLALLRDILVIFHSERSRLLVRHQLEDARLFEALESRVEDLKESSLRNDDLHKTLEHVKSIRKIRRHLPRGLSFSSEKKPFLRKDREWEKSITAEALFSGWHLYQVDAEVKIQEAEAWHHKFTRKLWPYGIILFTEKSECSEIPRMNLAEETQLSNDKESHTWCGTWYVVIDPEQLPDPTVLNCGLWKRIYPQRKPRSRSPQRL